MHCYLCEGSDFAVRKGVVRDNPGLRVLECAACGLVQLDSFEHIQPGHYESGNMHPHESLDTWISGTAPDDDRRFASLKDRLAERRVLDFGSGTGEFLRRAAHVAKTVAGVEPERRAHQLYGADMQLYTSIESIPRGTTFDVITAFHVVEHLTDPRGTLKSLSTFLDRGGRLIVEVPSASDALLTLYDSDAFSRFTYWSAHLFLFTPDSLRRVIEQAGLKAAEVEQVQRYPLSNHLYWLSKQKPGGHAQWAYLDSPALHAAYTAALAAVGKCDTLVAHIER
jgi:2-polyprenyl-3-methyl-5-hydroxy-6-metoxy-1,4-benzoquinol methylase